MKAKILILGILVVFITNIVSSQSFESQFKIIFGDYLSTHGKNDASRSFGKALSTSGNLKYNMELINAQNNKEITINLPPNTFLNQNNQVIPNQGYKWANQSNPADYNVVSIVSSATLPPYDLGILQNVFNMPFGAHPNLSELIEVGSMLKTLFTYNWVLDNGDGMLAFTEFNNVKRTFMFGEPIGFAYTFIAKCGSRNSGKDVADNISFLVQIFNNLNGDLIANKYYSFHSAEENVRFEHKVIYESLGKSLPPGTYLISVSITSSNRLTPHSITSLRGYFEVIE